MPAYLGYSRALQKGELKVAYEGLSERTRQLIEQRAKEISQASSGAVKEEPSALFFASAPRTQVLREVVVRSEDGGAAELTAKAADGQAATVHMVKEQGIWKVDLSGALDR